MNEVSRGRKELFVNDLMELYKKHQLQIFAGWGGELLIEPLGNESLEEIKQLMVMEY